MFDKQTVQDVDVKNKIVLVRVDYNVPFGADGEISDDYRVIAGLPTIEYLSEQGAKIILCSHLGRPKGVDPKLSLKPVFELLKPLLAEKKIKCGFVDEVVGDKVKKASKDLKSGEVLLLENLRFDEGEDKNSTEFAETLKSDTGAEIFVQDGFGYCHRKSATTEAITHLLPAVAGFLVEKEMNDLLAVITDPPKPFIAIVGGAKVSDKTPFLKKIINKADKIFIGGAMANAFLKFNGYETGLSMVDEGVESDIEEIYALAQQKDEDGEVNDFIVLPRDVVIASEISNKTETIITEADSVYDQDYILDIGPESRSMISSALKGAKTVFWNGTLGMTEYSKFAHGSNYVARHIGQADLTSVVCGGDTAGFVLNYMKKRDDLNFSLISTGGGASLELLAGDKLIGVESLMKKEK